MAISYSVSERKDPTNPMATPKWYANARVMANYTFTDLCRDVEKMSTVTEGDIMAVISTAISCMVNALRRGESVQFGDLGTFRVGLTSEGSETFEDFTAANIIRARVTFYAGKTLKEAAKSFQYKRVEVRPQTDGTEQTTEPIV